MFLLIMLGKHKIEGIWGSKIIVKEHRALERYLHLRGNVLERWKCKRMEEARWVDGGSIADVENER